MEHSLTFLTRRKRRIWLRPMRPDDVSHLIDIFAHLSPQSRYFRFHEPLEAPDPEQVEEKAREIAALDPDKGRGWLAFANVRGRRTPVGGIRWVRVDETTAEIALTVRDDFQGQGIGLELLRIAVLDADAAGVRRVVAVIQGANQSVVQLLRHAPAPIQKTISAGEIYVEADLREVAAAMREQAPAASV